MKIVGLDGKERKISLYNNRSSHCEARPRSSYHLLARKLIKELFSDFLAEEVYVPVENVYFDFFLPNRKIVIEVHGEQHYEQNSFFHKSKAEFLKQKLSDKKKRNLCEMNGFTYIELPYNEDEETWKNRLLKF